MKKKPQWLPFVLEGVTPLEDDMKFSAMAEKYQPTEGLSYLGFTFHATAPLVNMKGMTITYPTQLKSMSTAVDKMVDYEHQVEDLPTGAEDTIVVGHICELSLDREIALDDAEQWQVPPYIPRSPILTRGVMALYTRMASVSDVVQNVRDGDTWYFSLEVGNKVTPPEIWLLASNGSADEILSWDEASEELRTAASEPREMEYNGRKVSYLMGGRDGTIQYIGGAITKSPAGREQRVPGNSLMYICTLNGDDDQGYKKLSAKWTTAYKNSLPNSSFAVIEGDYLSGKSDNKSCRHLPFRDASGKVDLPHLRNALARVNQIKPVSGPESAEALQGKARSKLERYRKHLVTEQGGKAASQDGNAGMVPVEIDDFDAALELRETVSYIIAFGSNSNGQGGDNMPEISEEELKVKLAAAKKEAAKEAAEKAIAEAKEAGLVVDATELEGKFTQEDVDKKVAQAIRQSDREAKVAVLAVDDETKAEFKLLAMNAELYAFDDEGDEKFGKALERWKASIKPASSDGDDEKRTSSTGDKGGDKGGENFSPGGGDGGGGSEEAPQRYASL